MASSQEYLNFIIEQLDTLDDITFRKMMGEYILYFRGKIFGGIYDDRFLVKITKASRQLMLEATEELPYDDAKPMLLVDDVDNREFLYQLITEMYEELPTPKVIKKVSLRGENKSMCEECYSDKNRITPLLNPLDCLQKHAQYICGTCGRCICIEQDEKRGVQRWSFPFKSLEIAKLYLRTADYTMKKSCGIYEISSSKGRVSYKIFVSNEDLNVFLKKNKDKTCEKMAPVFTVGKYKEYPNTKVKKLTSEEIEKYMIEQNSK